MKRNTAQPKKQIHARIKRRSKLLLVPHVHNEYQPHLIRRAGIIAVIIFVFATQAFYNSSFGGSVLGSNSTMTTERLLALTNEQRRNNNEGGLAYNSSLVRAAQAKAEDMINNNYWSHESPLGVQPWKWIHDANYSYSYAGENLARNFSSAEGVVAAWMNSPEHRENILNPAYRDVGFSVISGTLQGKVTTLVVAMYGAPVTAMASTDEQPVMLAATSDASMSLMARLGAQLQMMSPVALASIVLLVMATLVALLAQAYRRYLPRPVVLGWRRHHGFYKAIGMTSLAVVFVALYGSGQI